MGLFRGRGRLTGATGRTEDAEFLVGPEVRLALESLSLAVDPLAKRLIPAKGFVGVG
jgi:hypothetical protein